MSNASDLEICPFIKFVLGSSITTTILHLLPLCSVNSLAFIICDKNGVSVSVYDVIHFCEKKGFEFLTVPSFNKLYIMFNSNCIILHVDTCSFVTINRGIFSCTNFNV